MAVCEDRKRMSITRHLENKAYFRRLAIRAALCVSVRASIVFPSASKCSGLMWFCSPGGMIPTTFQNIMSTFISAVLHNTQDYICTKWAYRRSWLSEALFCHHTCSKTALCYKHFWIAIRGVSPWSEDATLASNNRRLFQITPGRLYTPLQIPREPAIWAINTLRNGSLPPLPNTLSLCVCLTS